MGKSVKKTHRQKTRQRVVAGLGGLLVGATVPLVIAPTASADPCTIVSNPSEKQHTVCKGKDLRNQDFTGNNLEYAELDGSIFQGNQTMTKVNLRFAQFTGANLQNVLFRDANMFGANLTNARLGGAALRGTTDIEMTTLTGTQLVPPPRTRIQIPGAGNATSAMLAAQTHQIEGTRFAGCTDEDKADITTFQQREKPYKIECEVKGPGNSSGRGWSELVVERGVPSVQQPENGGK
ncbi:pentapeptide repeat-containing protein [Mycobacterium haemophilum]